MIYVILIRAMVSTGAKDNFVKQLENIVESVRANRGRIERRQVEEKTKRDLLNNQFTQLIDKGRQYAKVMKDFQEVILSISISSLLHSFSSRLFETMNCLLPNRNRGRRDCH